MSYDNEYLSEEREALLEALERAASIDSFAFCVQGSHALVLPGLDVEGVGEVSLPVRPEQAQALIEVAVQAPYGRGEETLVDTEVRKVWELQATQLSFYNPAWEEWLSMVVEDVQTSLGVPGEVKHHLYKLLVYEEGSFFVAHRDSEKEEGMFATLLVHLPSAHEGGVLEVRHNGEVERVDFSKKEGRYQLQYASFYADCEHEIEEVKEGYRVVLVYNLACGRGAEQPTVPDAEHHVHDVAACLQSIYEEDSGGKIVIPLQHQYSQVSLSFDSLKGGDRALVEILARAGDRADYDTFLAGFQYQQFGSSYEWDVEDAKMDEVYEEELELVGPVITRYGQALQIRAMNIAYEELLRGDAWETMEFEVEVEGPTGNAGINVTHQYRRSVAVLWKKGTTWRQILSSSGGIEPTLDWIWWLHEQGNLTKTIWDRALPWIRRRWVDLEAWGDASFSWKWLRLLYHREEERSLLKFIGGEYDSIPHPKDADWIYRCAEKFGWAGIVKELAHTFREPPVHQQSRREHLGLYTDLFVALVRKADSDVSLQACETWAKALAKGFRVTQELIEDHEYMMELKRIEKCLGRPFIRFLEGLCLMESEALLSSFLAYVLHHQVYDWNDLISLKVLSLFDDAQKLGLRSSQLAVVAKACIETLEKDVQEPVSEPQDWRTDPKGLKCEKGEKHCRALKRFLKDPEEQVFHLQARAEERRGVESLISWHKLELDIETNRRTRPCHTLVCTKNRADYHKKVKRYEEKIQDLKAFKSLLRKWT